MKELIQLVEARRRAAHLPHAVATVLRVEGSSYRRPGARMLVDVRGRVAGSVSGGCLERSVIGHAQAALLDGRSRLLSFDTTDHDDLAMGTSLGCEGKIWIGLEVLPAGSPWALEKIVDAVRQNREPAVLVTQIKTSNDDVAFTVSASDSISDSDPDASLTGEINAVFEARRTRFVGSTMSGSALLEYLAPPLTLLLFGGNHDVPPMVRLAVEMGHDVTVIDRRPDFARHDAFPGATRVLAAKPSQLPALLAPDCRAAAVLMNHHYDTDRDVLAALLPLGLPYLAMLGPRRRTERILAELEAEGHEVASSRPNIHGPAGLDIGAESPEEIALAVLAEIQAVLAGRQGGALRDRQAPIHADPIGAAGIPCARLG